MRYVAKLLHLPDVQLKSALIPQPLLPRQEQGRKSFSMRPFVLASNGWSQLHLEVFQQPKFEKTFLRIFY
jgi:hypothetical protein